jgi:hypothetical protein
MRQSISSTLTIPAIHDEQQERKGNKVSHVFDVLTMIPKGMLKSRITCLLNPHSFG